MQATKTQMELTTEAMCAQCASQLKAKPSADFAVKIVTPQLN